MRIRTIEAATVTRGSTWTPGWLAAATRTGHRPGLMVLRVVLALVVFPHGAQHALGWFGGYGFGGTLSWMTGSLGFPIPLAAVAILVELAAPVALLLGAGGRLAALGIAGIMVGAIGVHASSGFFMNWFGQLPLASEGFEYHLLVLGMTAAVMVDGSGAYSVDRRIWTRRSRVDPHGGRMA